MGFIKITTNVNKVVSSIRAQSLGGRKVLKVKVGFSATYSVHVHENLQAYHRVGMAKFLEIPARTKRQEMREIIRRTMRVGKRSLEDALLKAGNFLLAESRLLVPVLTGHLRDSGFVKVE